MKIYKGKVGLLGPGTWTTNAVGSGGTKHSIVEIGEHTLRDVWITDYFSNFIKTGAEARFGISGGGGRWLGKHLLLLETNGKKYKEGLFGLIMTYLYVILSCAVVGAVVLGILYLNNLFTPGIYMAIGLLCFVIYRLLSDILAFIRF